MFRHTGEALAQVLLLRCHADGAAVEVTDAGHHAAFGDHRDGAEAIFLSPQQRCDHHIPTGLETAVSPQQHTVAKTVLQQGSMHFREAQFPWTTGMLDRTQWGSSGAAVVAGNLNHIGIGLGNTGRNRADADLGDQLHAHRCSGMNLMQVMDQLSQIFD